MKLRKDQQELYKALCMMGMNNKRAQQRALALEESGADVELQKPAGENPEGATGDPEKDAKESPGASKNKKN